MTRRFKAQTKPTIIAATITYSDSEGGSRSDGFESYASERTGSHDEDDGDSSASGSGDPVAAAQSESLRGLKKLDSSVPYSDDDERRSDSKDDASAANEPAPDKRSRELKRLDAAPGAALPVTSSLAALPPRTSSPVPGQSRQTSSSRRLAEASVQAPRASAKRRGSAHK